MQAYHKYVYDGPVKEFDTIVADHWKGETMAPTETKAKSNLAYQFKKANNRAPRSKISLPGKCVMVS